MAHPSDTMKVNSDNQTEPLIGNEFRGNINKFPDEKIVKILWNYHKSFIRDVKAIWQGIYRRDREKSEKFSLPCSTLLICPPW